VIVGVGVVVGVRVALATVVAVTVGVGVGVGTLVGVRVLVGVGVRLPKFSALMSGSQIRTSQANLPAPPSSNGTPFELHVAPPADASIVGTAAWGNV